jgi:hypothetical protein
MSMDLFYKLVIFWTPVTAYLLAPGWEVKVAFCAGLVLFCLALLIYDINRKIENELQRLRDLNQALNVRINDVDDECNRQTRKTKNARSAATRVHGQNASLRKVVDELTTENRHLRSNASHNFHRARSLEILMENHVRGFDELMLR